MSRSFRRIPIISRWSLFKAFKPIGKLAPNQLHKLKPIWLKKHGPMLRYPGSKDRFVEIYKPEDIGKLLRADSKRPLRPVLPLIDLAIQRGHMHPSISHLNGSEWAEIRTKMQRIFLGPSAATQFYSQQLEVCEGFVQALGKEREEKGVVRDFRTWACRYAAESVGKVLLGAEMGSFADNPHSPGNRLCRTMDKLFALTAEGFAQPPWSTWYQTKLYKDWIHHHRISKLLVEELISLYGFHAVKYNGKVSNNALQASTDALQASTDALQASTDALQASTDALQASTDALQASTDALQADTDALQADTGALQADTGALQTYTDALQTDTDALQADTDVSTAYSSREDLSSPTCFFTELLAKQDISEKEAVDFAEELFIAGVESTGNALTFLVYHLARNLTVQDKLYNEIVKLCNGQEQITSDMLQCCTYLRACMKESMRLSPPVTGTVRITSCDLELSDYRIPTGTVVNTGSDVICQQEAYFSEASVFNPDRWLVGARQSIPPFAYIPFGHGARMCIGRRFAEQELMMAVISLMREYKIGLVDKDLQLGSVLKVFYSPDKAVDITMTQRRDH